MFTMNMLTSGSASEMTYIVSGGALNSIHSPVYVWIDMSDFELPLCSDRI